MWTSSASVCRPGGRVQLGDRPRAAPGGRAAGTRARRRTRAGRRGRSRPAAGARRRPGCRRRGRCRRRPRRGAPPSGSAASPSVPSPTPATTVPRPWRDVEHAVGAQQVERGGDGRAADGELGGQRALGRQRRAGREQAGVDQPAQAVGQALAQVAVTVVGPAGDGGGDWPAIGLLKHMPIMAGWPVTGKANGRTMAACSLPTAPPAAPAACSAVSRIVASDWEQRRLDPPALHVRHDRRRRRATARTRAAGLTAA